MTDDLSGTRRQETALTRIIFFGNERLATGVTTEAPTLRRLIAAGYEIAAVVSHNTDSRSRNNRQLEIAAVAAKHDIPVLLPDKPAEIIDQLRAYDAQVGVLVAYGKIVPQSIIDIFPHGIVNIHPSLLPLHRGPIPIESVILDGSAETGVSVMQLVRAMDAGPVYGQERLSLGSSETKQELADKLLDIGGQLVLRLLPDILDGTCQPRPQEDSQATYDALITKDDGKLDFTKPAVHLEREVRAYLDWPKSRTTLFDTEIIITNAHVLSTLEDGIKSDSDTDNSPGSLWRSGKQLGISTSDGILVIYSLKPAGKSEMTAESFLSGYAK